MAKAGKKVTLIEAGRLINGVTGHTTAKITAQHSLVYAQLIKTFGENKAKQYYDANIESLDFIRQLIKELNIQCAYETKNAFIYAESHYGKRKLEREAAAYQALGINGVLAKEKAALPFSIKEALVMYDQAQFDSVLFLTAIVREIIRLGGTIFEHTRAMEILKETTPLILTENNSLILCEKVIIATHYPINDAILVATGFNKWGMSAGTVAAKLLKDTILGQENRYTSLFDPTRKKLKLADAKSFLWKNTSVRKDFVVGKLKRPDKKLADLSLDEGGLVNVKGEKVGAYRDEQGYLHKVVPVCTHLGCSLDWNDAERSWDCACHGSRFSYKGEVLEGPAVKPLPSSDI